jgi:hypothetical protein
LLDTLLAETLPFRSPELWLVARLTAGLGELGPRRVAVHWLDADERILADQGFSLSPTPASQARPPKLQIAARFESVEFRAYGTYVLQLLVDSQEKVRIPFTVVHPSQPA